MGDRPRNRHETQSPRRICRARRLVHLEAEVLILELLEPTEERRHLRLYGEVRILFA